MIRGVVLSIAMEPDSGLCLSDLALQACSIKASQTSIIPHRKAISTQRAQSIQSQSSSTDYNMTGSMQDMCHGKLAETADDVYSFPIPPDSRTSPCLRHDIASNVCNAVPFAPARSLLIIHWTGSLARSSRHIMLQLRPCGCTCSRTLYHIQICHTERHITETERPCPRDFRIHVLSRRCQ